MDDEGGGPISGTSSMASGDDGLSDTLDTVVVHTAELCNLRGGRPPRAVLRQLEVAGCHEDRSPPLRGLT